METMMRSCHLISFPSASSFSGHSHAFNTTFRYLLFSSLSKHVLSLSLLWIRVSWLPSFLLSFVKKREQKRMTWLLPEVNEMKAGNEEAQGENKKRKWIRLAMKKKGREWTGKEIIIRVDHQTAGRKQGRETGCLCLWVCFLASVIWSWCSSISFFSQRRVKSRDTDCSWRESNM